MPQDPLVTYLTDHLAGAEAACKLIGRLATEHADDRLGAFFLALLTEVRADQQTLAALVERLGGARAPLKNAAGRLAERFTRPKLQPARSGELALVESLEVLSLGILGKSSLWRALSALDDPRLANLDLEALVRRADSQYADVEAERLVAARQALGMRVKELAT
jgi:hypothetical protein